MNIIQSSSSKSTISVDYDDFTNTVEIHIGNESGFRFVNLTETQCEEIIEFINVCKQELI